VVEGRIIGWEVWMRKESRMRKWAEEEMTKKWRAVDGKENRGGGVEAECERLEGVLC